MRVFFRAKLGGNATGVDYMSATTEICGKITGKHFRQFGRPVVMDYLNSSGQPEKCDKCATLGQNQEKSTATMRGSFVKRLIKC
jgi:hypothetical protein